MCRRVNFPTLFPPSVTRFLLTRLLFIRSPASLRGLSCEMVTGGELITSLTVTKLACSDFATTFLKMSLSVRIPILSLFFSTTRLPTSCSTISLAASSTVIFSSTVRRSRLAIAPVLKSRDTRRVDGPALFKGLTAAELERFEGSSKGQLCFRVRVSDPGVLPLPLLWQCGRRGGLSRLGSCLRRQRQRSRVADREGSFELERGLLRAAGYSIGSNSSNSL